MRFGKLSAEELQKLVLDKLPHRRGEVILSAAQGEDCSAVKTDGILLVSSDPITAAMSPESLGELCVSVCCNDIAACGGEPFALTVTLIMPPSAPTEDIERIMSGAMAKAESVRVDIIGGHTEFSDCVVRPIISGTAIGKTNRLMAKTALQVGDGLYVTKTLAMEGTAIIADGGRETFTKEEKAIIESYRNGLDVAKESEILRAFESVSVMHDITEGGVIGAVAEICLGSGKGADICEQSFPVSALTRRLCDRYGIDPARFISSGSMLFAARSDEAAVALRGFGIPVTQIGKVTSGDILLVKADGTRISVRPETDEMYKYYERCGT